MNPETQALWDEYNNLHNTIGRANQGSYVHLSSSNPHKGTDLSGLYNAPAKSTSTTPPWKPKVGDVWAGPTTGKVRIWNGLIWVNNDTDEDLVEVRECIACSTELKGEEQLRWNRCNDHLPNFDEAFTADEQDLYSGKLPGGAMAVGIVRHINQLELLIENLQEQIIELNKRSN